MLERIRHFQGADQLDLFGPPRGTMLARIAAILFRFGRVLNR